VQSCHSVEKPVVVPSTSLDVAPRENIKVHSGADEITADEGAGSAAPPAAAEADVVGRQPPGKLRKLLQRLLGGCGCLSPRAD
jgi:hypothetical protein